MQHKTKEPGCNSGPSKTVLQTNHSTIKNNFETLGAICIGRWLYILANLGIDSRFLVDRHGPCPACGGTDRFRFDNRNGRGTFFCSHCGAGDGFRLLQLVFSWTPAQSLHEVAVLMGLKTGRTFSGTMPPPAPTTKTNVAQVKEKTRKRLNGIFAGTVEATPGTQTHTYLTLTRALPLANIPTSLRHHPGLIYWEMGTDGKPRNRGKFPAMIALISDSTGKPAGLHLTFLTPEGKKLSDRPAKKRLSLISGGTIGSAIQLRSPTDKLAVAEGIESALAVHCATGVPVWAAGSAHFLSKMGIPKEVKNVAIYADNDENQCGQKAANTLAERLTSEGKRVEIFTPPEPGTDWLDVLYGGGM